MTRMLVFTTEDGYSGLARSLDQARRMGFELVSVTVVTRGKSHLVSLTLAGQTASAFHTLTARINNDLGSAIERALETTP